MISEEKFRVNGNNRPLSRIIPTEKKMQHIIDQQDIWILRLLGVFCLVKIRFLEPLFSLSIGCPTAPSSLPSRKALMLKPGTTCSPLKPPLNLIGLERPLFASVPSAAS